VGTYKGNIQLTVNMFFNSSWAIFKAPSSKKKSSDDIIPLAFFGSTMHTEMADTKIVQQLQNWSSTIFLKNAVLSNKYIT
jgi:hypothetical protein